MTMRIVTVLVGLLVCNAAMTQAQPISQGLGVMVYPAKNQTSTVQAADEHDCYNWAQNQTGITPGPPPTTAATAPPQQASGGGAAGGAVRGAAGGAIIGAVAGDAGKGAAIGATTGVLVGGARARRAQEQQQAQAQQTQQTTAANQKAYNDRMATFKKAFGVCMQGRNYSVSN